MTQNSTFSSQETKPLSIEDIKMACDMLIKKEEKPLPKGLSWFSKLMNKLGWHRKYEILIIDKEKIKREFFHPKENFLV